MTNWNFKLWINRQLDNGLKGYVLLFVVALVFLVLVVLCSTLVDTDFWWNAYYALGLNPVAGEVETHRHVVIYLLVGICGALVFGGLMVTVFTSGVERYVERVQRGYVRYRNLKDHVVIVGWTPITTGLIEQAAKKYPSSRIVLLNPHHTEDIVSELSSTLPEETRRRTIVYTSGEGGLFAQIDQLCLDTTCEVFITLGNSEIFTQPATQLTLLQLIASKLSSRSTPLRVNVMIENLDTYITLQRIDMHLLYKDVGDKLDIRLFNFYENWARTLWGYGGDGRYDTLDFEPIEGSDNHVHLVIAGFQNMGKALLLEALRVCHYPNKQTTQITIIDPDANEHQDLFLTQHPHIDAIKDISIDFIADRLESPKIREQLVLWGNDEKKMLTIAICSPDPAYSFCAAQNLPESLFCHPDHVVSHPLPERSKYDLTENNSRTHILFQQNILRNMDNLVDPLVHPHFHPFGTLLPEGADVDLLDDDIAITINGLYHDHLNASQFQEPLSSRFPIWKELWNDHTKTPDSSKHASRYQSDLFRSTMAILKRSNGKDNEALLEELSECEHRRWIAERTLMNWKSTRNGEPRNDRLRLHDCLCDYDDLSEAEKQKDRNVVMLADHLASG